VRVSTWRSQRMREGVSGGIQRGAAREDRNVWTSVAAGYWRRERGEKRVEWVHREALPDEREVGVV